MIDRAVAFAAEVAANPKHERLARLATDALYNVASAALMTWEGATSGASGKDARRLLMARMVVEHRLRPADPLGDPSVGLGRSRNDRLARPERRRHRASRAAGDRLKRTVSVHARDCSDRLHRNRATTYRSSHLAQKRWPRPLLSGWRASCSLSQLADRDFRVVTTGKVQSLAPQSPAHASDRSRGHDCHDGVFRRDGYPVCDDRYR